jgi:hypothetical protein
MRLVLVLIILIMPVLIMLLCGAAVVLCHAGTVLCGYCTALLYGYCTALSFWPYRLILVPYFRAFALRYRPFCCARGTSYVVGVTGPKGA